jgi:hypothetical protein
MRTWFDKCTMQLCNFFADTISKVSLGGVVCAAAKCTNEVARRALYKQINGGRPELSSPGRTAHEKITVEDEGMYAPGASFAVVLLVRLGAEVRPHTAPVLTNTSASMFRTNRNIYNPRILH